MDQVNTPKSKRPRTSSNKTKYQFQDKEKQVDSDEIDSKRTYVRRNLTSVKETSVKRTCPFYKRVPGESDDQ